MVPTKPKPIMKALLAVLLLCSASIGFAQVESTFSGGNYHPWSKDDESDKKELEAFTLVSDANLRERPAADAATIQKLPIDTKLVILEATKTMTKINGFEAPWCKVRLFNGKTGYIWGGALACARLFHEETYDPAPGENRYGMSYLVGVSSMKSKEGGIVLQMRMARDGKELSKIEFPTEGGLEYYITMENKEMSSLKNVQETIEVYTGYDACGFVATSNLVFLNQNKLQFIMATTQSADGGAYFSSEDVLLPGEKGGIADHVVVISDMQSFKDVKDQLVVDEQKYSVVVYKWNGAKLMKEKELKY
jgi:hypothetical protein